MSWSRQILKKVVANCIAPERLLIRGPSHRLAERPTISLTFDDGPDDRFTPPTLAALRRWQVPATFFVIGCHAEQHPDLVRWILNDGHELGNHTYTHGEPSLTSAAAFLTEVAAVQQLLQSQIQHHGRLIRPPRGELTCAKVRGLWRGRLSIVLWNVDPRDFEMSSTAEAEHWAQAYQPRHGDVILLHDNHAAAATIVETLGQRGVFERFRVLPVGRWLQAGHGRRPVPAAAMVGVEKST